MSQQQKVTSVGTADNVDVREDDSVNPFTHDVDSHRVIEGHCAHCRLTEIVHAEPGRRDEWTHAVDHPDHMVIYELMEASR